MTSDTHDNSAANHSQVLASILTFPLKKLITNVSTWRILNRNNFQYPATLLLYVRVKSDDNHILFCTATSHQHHYEGIIQAVKDLLGLPGSLRQGKLHCFKLQNVEIWHDDNLVITDMDDDGGAIFVFFIKDSCSIWKLSTEKSLQTLLF